MTLFEIAILLICVIIICVIIISVIEIRQLNITSYIISHDKISKEFNGYKIVLLSDLHNCFYNVDKIISTIKKEQPNAVIIAGDMLVYKDNKKAENLRSLDLIRDISRYSDVYFAPGNHEMGYMLRKEEEWLSYEKFLLESSSENIYFLDNKKIELSLGNSKLNIYGLHLSDGYYKRFIKKKLNALDISKLLGDPDKESYNLLIAHNPDYFQEYVDWGADLVLSGHNHGGLLKLPLLGGVISPRLHIFPKYDYGLFHLNNSSLILSGGLGAHSLKIRINNKPELVIINLAVK